VTSVREAFCPGVQSQPCQIVHATIATGAEKGRRIGQGRVTLRH
jgi:hypothetical protein